MSQFTIYHPIMGRRQIASIDFTSAWEAQGWSRSPVEPIAVSPEPQPPAQIGLSVEDIPAEPAEFIPALGLINRAEAVADLTPLPSVGAAAAQLILDNRPEGGYSDLESLPAEIFKSPYRCSIEKIGAWMDAQS